MKKEEYLMELQETRKEIEMLEKKTRTRNIRIKLKAAKKKEKELLKLIKNSNERFTKSNNSYSIPCRNIEISEVPKKKKTGLFKNIKRRLFATFALLGTAASMITGAASLSHSAGKNSDTKDNTHSVTQTMSKSQCSDNNIKQETVNNKEENNNGIKTSSIDFDTLIYNSQITVKDDAKIYSSVYDVNCSEGFNPYYESTEKRDIMGVTFEKNGQLLYIKKIDEHSYMDMHSLLCNGAKVVSVITSLNGSDYEGVYDITDIDKIYINQSDNGYQKVLKK